MVEKCAVGHNVYEDTLRVPLIFHWPSEFARGWTYDGLAELTDLYPTLLELTGIDRPVGGYDLPGRSLTAILTGGSIPRKPYVVSENWSQVTVIAERYKLGKWITPLKYTAWDWGRTHPGMLFDRKNDPLEVNNLINEPYMNDVREELDRFLAEWEARIPDDGKKEVAASFRKV
jgi:arylsulfatase A-like enzyme